MTLYSNTFEGGTSGTTVTTANSGGASGDAFTAVSVGTGATVAFDNTRAAHGSLSLLIATGATSVAAYVERTFPAATTTAAIRFYLYVTANPTANLGVAGVFSGATLRARLRLTTAGQLVLLDAAGGTVISQTGTVPLNQWFRVEAQFPALDATVGQATLTRYNTADATTASETATSAANKNFGGTGDRVRYGVTAATANIASFSLDDVAQNDTGAAIGPAAFTPTGSAVLTVTAAGTTGSIQQTATGSGLLTLTGTAGPPALAAAGSPGAASLTLTAAATTTTGEAAGGAAAVQLTAWAAAAVTTPAGARAAMSVAATGGAAPSVAAAAAATLTVLAAAAAGLTDTAAGGATLDLLASAAVLVRAVRNITLTVGALTDGRIAAGALSGGKVTAGLLTDSRWRADAMST